MEDGNQPESGEGSGRAVSAAVEPARPASPGPGPGTAPAGARQWGGPALRGRGALDPSGTGSRGGQAVARAPRRGLAPTWPRWVPA